MKKTWVLLMAVLLLLLTACSETTTAKPVDLNGEGYMPLPLEEITWELSLNEIQTKYPAGEIIVTGEGLTEFTTYVVKNGDFGQVLGADVKEIWFVCKPVLAYNGQSNADALYKVSFVLETDDYDGFSAKLDEQYGEGADKKNPATNAKYCLWFAENGLYDMPVKEAALTLALPINPVNYGQLWQLLGPPIMGEITVENWAKDVSDWKNLDLESEDYCTQLVQQVTEGEDSRMAALYDYDELVLEYTAGCMFCAPQAQNLLNGK